MREFPILVSMPEWIEDPNAFFTWEEMQKLFPVYAEEFRTYCRNQLNEALEADRKYLGDLFDEGLWRFEATDVLTDPDSDGEDTQYFWLHADGRVARFFHCDAHYHYWHFRTADGKWMGEDDVAEGLMEYV